MVLSVDRRALVALACACARNGGRGHRVRPAGGQRIVDGRVRARTDDGDEGDTLQKTLVAA